MKFSGSDVVYDNINVTKNQGFTLFLEDTLFEKLIPSHSRFMVN